MKYKKFKFIQLSVGSKSPEENPSWHLELFFDVSVIGKLMGKVHGKWSECTRSGSTIYLNEAREGKTYKYTHVHMHTRTNTRAHI